MTRSGCFRGALSTFLLSCVLAVAPAAGDPIDDCFDYANSSWSDDYLTCAGTGDGCSICVGSILVYKGQDGGGETPPLGPEFAALLPALYDADRWLDHGEAAPPVSASGEFLPRSGEFLPVKRACAEGSRMFDALDPRQGPARVPAPRAATPPLQPAPAP